MRRRQAAGAPSIRWEVLSPFLDELVELTGETRALRLQEIARHDADLAAELTGLLARLDEVERAGFLEGQALDPDVATLQGRTVGAYTIERALGQGGMGTVWLARRSDGRFEGLAAVKFLHLSLLGRSGAERFRREGSILARLSHPNIGRLLDAGVAAGQPYLVLEYVEGAPIDAWCDQRALDVRRRIELFLTVLGAVAHAHDRMVLHRDLKPSNILVTSQAEPKLLDFGIAKLLERETSMARATELTAQAGKAFTPGWAAPEQVQGGDATPATDIYALGVTLHRLLVDSHPTADPSSPPAEQLRALVERPPVRASDAAVRIDPACARRRGSTPAQLAKALRGDIDNILAKALEKAPGRRYVTVHALADDLRRHLAREPVAAVAPTLGYRLGKAVRRHLLAFSAAAAVAVALVAGVVGTTWEAVEARRQRSQAIRERERADREAQRAKLERDFALRQRSRAEAVADLDSFLLYEAAPNGTPFTVDDLLARADRIVSRQEPASDPNRVEMLISIGRSYYDLEEIDRSRRLLGLAYDVSRGIDEPIVRARAACAYAATLAESGDARAEAMVVEALSALPDETQFALDRIFCLQRGSEVARAIGDPAVAVERSRAAAGLLPQVGFPATFLRARATLDLAQSYQTAGLLDEALGAFEHAWEQLRALGRDDTETAGTVLTDWAATLLGVGRPVEAEPLLRRALRIGSAGGRRVSPIVLWQLARTLRNLGHYREAAALAERAQALARRNHEDRTINDALLTLATTYRRMGDLPRAARALDEFESRLRKAAPPGAPGFAIVEAERAFLALSRGEPGVARAAADRAVSMAEASGPEWLRSDVAACRSYVELEGRRWMEARHDAERAIEQARAVHAAGASDRLGLGYLSLGRALRGLGAAGAREAFASASENLRLSLGPRHELTLQAERLAAEAAR